MSPLERPTGFATPDHLRVLRRRRLRFTGGAVVIVMFGLLLWARFILVTGHPRTAVAEPPEQAGPSVTVSTPGPTDSTPEKHIAPLPRE